MHDRARRSPGAVSIPEALEDGRATIPAEVIMYLAEDHERIALGLNDVVARRLFAAGLDLEVALGLIGEHLAAGKIRHAIDELDLAIRDIRDVIFDHAASDGYLGNPRHDRDLPPFPSAQEA